MFEHKFEVLKNIKAIIGIDIAKKDHYASIISKERIKLVESFSFENSRVGFNSLVKQIREFDKNEIIFGMEPTGHYWKSLAYYLRELGYKIVLVNPSHTKKSKELRGNHTSKSDKRDSLLICNLIRDGIFLNPVLLDGIYADLRILTTLRESLIKEIGVIRNKLIRILDEYLPEYYYCFYDVVCKTSVKLLGMFGIIGLKNCDKKREKLALILKTSKHAISEEKAKKILNILNHGIGHNNGIVGAEESLKYLLKKLNLIKEEVSKLNSEIEKCLSKTEEAKYLLSMKGIGIVIASGILGQTGSFKRYKRSKQIEKLAGLLLSENSSGKYKGLSKISKRGRKYLRTILFQLAVGVVSNNDEFKRLYAYKKATNKKGRVAIISIAIKILKILFSMIKNKKEYDGSLVLQGLSS